MSSKNQFAQHVMDVSLMPLIKASGVELTEEGQIWKGPCPFHSDTGQSLIMTPDQSHWECPVCQTGGSVVEWVMKTNGISRSHAMELLRNDAPLYHSSPETPIQHSSVRHLDAPFEMANSDQEILQQVVNYYHETLKQSPQALDYLMSRGLQHPQLIEYFKLGFSNRTLGYRLPEKNRKEGAALRGRLQRLGILKASGHELFHGSLVVPILDNGLVMQVYGRKVTEKLRPGTPKHTYLPEVKQGFFHLKAVQTCEELIVCSSIIDALTFWCAGYQHVTCYYCGDHFTNDDIELLNASPVSRVLLACAGTKSGDEAALALSTQFAELGIDTYRIEFPGGLDANTFALAQASASDSLGELIRKAVWLGKGQAPARLEVHPSDSESQASSVGSNRGDDSDLPSETEVAEPAASTSTDAPDLPVPPRHAEAASLILPASVLPAPATEMEAEVKDNEIILCVDERRYRVRGLEKNLAIDQLKVNLLVSKDTGLHVDTLDLYAAKARRHYIAQAAQELGETQDTIKHDLAKVMLKLEVLQDRYVQQATKPTPIEVSLSKHDKDEAMALLQSPDLVRRILHDCEQCGVVGETTNKLVGYLAALSRKLDKPLAVIIQSTSAAGKSALMEAVLAFVPEEERVQYSAVTGQSLFYMDDISLTHKVLAIAEEEGARHATYSLKILQSEGQLRIASTGKDPNSGRHVTREYKVDGPVMIFSTTTAIEIDEELLNRCLVLSVDEDREQTRAIHDYQRFEETLAGLQVSQVREDILRVHRNAQRLLKPLKVVNPYAEQLTFLDDKTRTRRDHKKYLTLIRSIALLHQYQREVKQTYVNGKSVSYVEVTLDDIALANQLAHEVLGRSLDELPPQTRRLLRLIDDMVTQYGESVQRPRSELRFTRRDIRAYTGWGDTQLKVHCQRLEAMEYLLVHRGGRGKQIVYELLYNREGSDGKPFVMGLVDVATLKTDLSAMNDSLSGASRDKVGTNTVSGQTRQIPSKRRLHNHLAQKTDDDAHNALMMQPISPASYSHSQGNTSHNGGRV